MGSPGDADRDISISRDPHDIILFAVVLLVAVGASVGGTIFFVGGSEEPATGFTIYVDQLVMAAGAAPSERTVYLPTGYDLAVAASLRGDGWRTIAQIGENEDPSALGCSHRLEGSELTEL